MPDFLVIVVAGVVGYGIGSVPFAYLVARRCGVDILKAGSGNPGATNVKRTVGRRAGNAVFVLDFLKGAVAAAWPRLAAADEQTALVAAVVGLTGAVLGHSYPVFLRFRGGKGVAVTMGGLLAVMPVVVLVGMGVWLLVFQLFRYVSLASLCFAASLPLSTAALSADPPLFYFSLAVSILIFYRHRGNIKSLLQGKESRFQRTGKVPEGNDEGHTGI